MAKLLDDETKIISIRTYKQKREDNKNTFFSVLYSYFIAGGYGASGSKFYDITLTKDNIYI